MNKPLKFEFKLYFASLLYFFISSTWLCMWPAQFVAILWQYTSLTSFVFTPKYQQAFLLSLKVFCQHLYKKCPIPTGLGKECLLFTTTYTLTSLSAFSLSSCFACIQLACAPGFHRRSTRLQDSPTLGSSPTYIV